MKNCLGLRMEPQASQLEPKHICFSKAAMVTKKQGGVLCSGPSARIQAGHVHFFGKAGVFFSSGRSLIPSEC